MIDGTSSFLSTVAWISYFEFTICHLMAGSYDGASGGLRGKERDGNDAIVDEERVLL